MKVKNYFDEMSAAETQEFEEWLDKRFQEIQDEIGSKEQTEDAKILQFTPVEKYECSCCGELTEDDKLQECRTNDEYKTFVHACPVCLEKGRMDCSLVEVL